jgi:hypothetical protein
MFKIEIFVEDKKLAEALRGLVGLALEAPKVTPIVNAKAHKGKVVAATNGDPIELFQKYARDKALKDSVTVKDLKGFASSIGRSATSYSHFLNKLVEANILKKHKIPGKKGANSMRYTLVNS